MSVTATIDRPELRTAPQWACQVVCATVALVLLAAMGLKAHQLATGPVIERGFLSQRWVMIAGFQWELVLGLVLLSGAIRRLAWLAAVGTFLLLTAVTLSKALGGEVSCGCWGRIEVNPWWTLVLDVGLLGALLACRPALRGPIRVRPAAWRIAGVAVVTLAIGLPAGIVAGLYEPARLLADGSILGDDGVVVLEPETWPGRRLPLLPFIDIGESLVEGRWTVVLYHHDCPHCQEAMPKYIADARKLTDSGSSTRMALIEMPPYAKAGESPIPSDTACTQGRLNEAHDWFAETPTVISLAGGTVVGHQIAQSAAKGPSPTTKPSAVIAVGVGAKGEFDFRYVPTKSTHYVDFEIRNGKSQAVAVRSIRSECKCMKVSAGPKALPANSVTRLRVGFVAPDKAMRYDKRIVIQTSDPARKVIALRVMADVGRPIEVRPQVIALGALPAGLEHRAVVTLVNHGEVAVRPIYGTSTTPQCTARIPRATIGASGGTLAIPIVIRPTGPAGRKHTVTVHIHTNCRTQSQISVRTEYQIAAGGQTAAAASKGNP